MTDAEMLFRLKRGEDMRYYKLTPDRNGFARKTAEESAVFTEDELFESQSGKVKRDGIWVEDSK